MSSRKSERRKKQTRLSFTPVASSSPQRSEARVRINDASTPRKRRRIIDSASDSAEGLSSHDLTQAIALSKMDNLRAEGKLPHRETNQLPTPEPSSQIERPDEEGGRRLRSHRGVNAQMPAHGAATRSSKTRSFDIFTTDSDEEAPVHSSRRTRPAHVTVDSSTEDSEPITPATKRPRRDHDFTSRCASSESPPKITPSRAPTARSFLAGGNTGNAPLPRSQRPISRFSQPKRGVHQESSESDSEVLKSAIKKSVTVRTRRQKVRQAVSNEDEEEGSDNLEKSPISRRGNKQRSEEQNEDEDSMLEELAVVEDDSDPAGRRTRGRQNSSARSKRLEGLAKLRQRRAGVREVSEDYIVEEDDDNRQDGDDMIDNDSFDEELASEERVSKTLDDYESDFVEDDGEIGIDLMRHGVPLRFTGHANKKPLDYFKDEIEWMVHNKLDPAFERHDEIYKMAHRKLDDEVIGLAGSEFKSSAWGLNFTKTLQSRPEFFTTAVTIEAMERKCEACNRSRHPPKEMITFSGPSYDHDSLEKVSRKHHNDSASSSEDEDDDEGDEKEERYHVGSVCCVNAEIAHTLYHWRFQLNTTVLHWLNINGYTSPAKILERENWPRKRREKLANKVVDGMVESGEMRSLYQQFKQNLDAARDAKAERTER